MARQSITISRATYVASAKYLITASFGSDLSAEFGDDKENTAAIELTQFIYFNGEVRLTLGRELSSMWEKSDIALTLAVAGSQVTIPGPDSTLTKTRDSTAGYQFAVTAGTATAVDTWLRAYGAANSTQRAAMTLTFDDGAVDAVRGAVEATAGAPTVTVNGRAIVKVRGSVEATAGSPTAAVGTPVTRLRVNSGGVEATAGAPTVSVSGRAIRPTVPIVTVTLAAEAAEQTVYRARPIAPGRAGGWTVSNAVGVTKIAAGKGIKSVMRDAGTGVVTITYTDDTSDDFTIADGTSISKVARDDATGVVTFTFSDSTTATFTVPDGDAGNGIKSIARNDTTGVVTVTYDDDSTDTFTVQDGAKGGLSEWIYRGTTTNTKPAAPTTSTAEDEKEDHVPTGWDDDPVEAAYVWVSKRKRATGTDAFGKFSTPAPFRGAPGPRGIAGTIWHYVTAAPLTSLGNNGDFAIVTSGAGLGDVYTKAAGAWTKRANLKGADGSSGGTWLTGSDAPDDANGDDGNYYFKTGSDLNAGSIYRKSGGKWGLLFDIDGGDIATWLTGAGAPGSTTGEKGDFYFRTSNGFVYEKTSATVWTYRADITGPQGPAGGGISPAYQSVVWRSRNDGTTWAPPDTKQVRYVRFNGVQGVKDGLTLAFEGSVFEDGEVSARSITAIPDGITVDYVDEVDSEFAFRQLVNITHTDSGAEATIAFDALLLTAGGADPTVPRLEATPSGLSLAEGRSATISVRFTAPITADATVTATSSNSTALAISGGASKTFTPANWSTGQTWTITAASDPNADETREKITFRAVGGATTRRDVSVFLSDQTRQDFEIDDRIVEVTEGDAVTIKVRLLAEPSGSVVVTASVPTSASQRIRLTGATSRTFNASNYRSYQNFTVQGIRGGSGFNVNLTASGALTGSDSVWVVVHKLPPDSATTTAPTLPAAQTVPEAWVPWWYLPFNGADPDYANAIDATAFAFTMLAGSAAQGESIENYEAQFQILFTAADSVRTNSSTNAVAGDDGTVVIHFVTPQIYRTSGDTRQRYPASVQVRARGRMLTSGGVTAWTRWAWVPDDDHDTPTLQIHPDDLADDTTEPVRQFQVDNNYPEPDYAIRTVDFSRRAVREGQTQTIRVRLEGKPPDNVEVDASVHPNAAGSVSGGPVTFTPSNWNTYQELTFAAGTVSVSTDTAVAITAKMPIDGTSTDIDTKWWFGIVLDFQGPPAKPAKPALYGRQTSPRWSIDFTAPVSGAAIDGYDFEFTRWTFRSGESLWRPTTTTQIVSTTSTDEYWDGAGANFSGASVRVRAKAGSLVGPWSDISELALTQTNRYTRAPAPTVTYRASGNTVLMAVSWTRQEATLNIDIQEGNESAAVVRGLLADRSFSYFLANGGTRYRVRVGSGPAGVWSAWGTSPTTPAAVQAAPSAPTLAVVGTGELGSVQISAIDDRGSAVWQIQIENRQTVEFDGSVFTGDWSAIGQSGNGVAGGTRYVPDTPAVGSRIAGPHYAQADVEYRIRIRNVGGWSTFSNIVSAPYGGI